MEREFDVIRSFAGVAAISGAQRLFKPGEVVACDPAQSGPTLTIEKASAFFIVERSVFKACCKTRNAGAVS